MVKVAVAVAGVWVLMGLLGVGVVSPPGTEAAAAPVPCCGRFAAGALGFAGVSRRGVSNSHKREESDRECEL